MIQVEIDKLSTSTIIKLIVLLVEKQIIEKGDRCKAQSHSDVRYFLYADVLQK